MSAFTHLQLLLFIAIIAFSSQSGEQFLHRPVADCSLCCSFSDSLLQAGIDISVTKEKIEVALTRLIILSTLQLQSTVSSPQQPWEAEPTDTLPTLRKFKLVYLY